MKIVTLSTFLWANFRCKALFLFQQPTDGVFYILRANQVLTIEISMRSQAQRFNRDVNIIVAGMDQDR